MNLKRDSPLLIAAAFAMLWVIARACVQSITFDEAFSYLTFAAPAWPAQWTPSSSNHVLHTALVRLVTSVFGLSHLTVRIPALLGAAIYIGVCLRLSRLLAPGPLFQLSLFICLTCNPFVQDYLVASRGYSLALAFFTAVLAIVIRVCLKREATLRTIAIASICAGLSFCANFSFAFADAVAILALIWCCWPRKRLLAAALLPGIVVTLCICGETLLHWQKGHLYYGAASVSQMLTEFIRSCLVTPNPHLSVFKQIGQALPILFSILLAVQLVLAALRKAVLPPLLFAVFLATFAIHWLAFRLFGLPLPLDRTGLFFVPLLLVLLAATVPRRSAATVAWFVFAAIYFAGCLRLSWFKEWRYDADTRAIYFVLNNLARRQPINNAYVDWKYTACVNFYSQSFGGALPHFEDLHVPPLDRPVYVLYKPEQRSFIESQHLHVIYKGAISEAVVATR